MALWLAAIFGSAGRLDWARGWIYVALFVGAMVLLGIIVRRLNPEVLKARANWRHRDTKSFDKAFLPVFAAFTFIQLAIAGLDAVRFRLSPLPLSYLWPGAILLLGGMTLMTWALAVNPHAETTVRIQTERGHRVITSGPYRFVRHPMYTGAILMYVAAPLILGSGWALIGSAAIALLFVWRTVLEDQVLRQQLAGYEEYAVHTRYRLIPGVW